MNRFVIWGLSLAVLGMPLSAQAGGEKPKQKKNIVVLQVNGKLTAEDPRDERFAKSPSKTFKMKLSGDHLVRIDLTSKDVDCFLRVEDETGKLLAQDDDGGGDWNARILFTPSKPGIYRVIVTCFPNNPKMPGLTGAFSLKAMENPALGTYLLHEKVLLDIIAVIDRLATALDGVKDAESAKAAAPQIETISKRWHTMQTISKGILPLAPVDDAKLKAKYDQQILLSLDKLQKAAARAGRNAGGEPSFIEALKKLDKR